MQNKKMPHRRYIQPIRTPNDCQTRKGISIKIAFAYLQSMELSQFVAFEQGPKLNLIHWLQNRSLLANPLRCAQCNINMDLKERNDNHVDGFHW